MPKKVDIKTSTVFERNYFSTTRFVVNRGGTRAGKTYSIMQMFALWLMTGRIREKTVIKKGVASIVRKTLPSLKTTALKDFEEILQNWGVFNRVVRNKTELTYTYKGRTVEFFSVDNQQKVRGRKRNILLCNEGNELFYDTDFFQLNIRTTDLVIIDLNPSDPYTWIKTELEDNAANVEGGLTVIVSTYKDNPFLDDMLRRQIEAIKDPVMRAVYVNGEYGAIKGLVFPSVEVVDSFPSDLKKVAIGLDFGYTNDPTAIVRCGVRGDDLYIDELCYQYAMSNADIVRFLKANCKGLQVYADSAEPKSIAEIRSNKVRCYPVKKGKDSIKYSIDLMRRYNIKITSNSRNLLMEQKTYKYKQNPNGEFYNEPIDDNNHAWDAVRYYSIMKINSRAGTKGFG